LGVGRGLTDDEVERSGLQIGDVEIRGARLG
jgi:hypothetical protein